MLITISVSQIQNDAPIQIYERRTTPLQPFFAGALPFPLFGLPDDLHFVLSKFDTFWGKGVEVIGGCLLFGYGFGTLWSVAVEKIKEIRRVVKKSGGVLGLTRKEGFMGKLVRVLGLHL
jgi:hypothetical protein